MFTVICGYSGVFPSGSVVKNLPASAGDGGVSVWSLSLEDSLEEGMSTHSSILAREIPWTEEPGGLQSVGSQSQTQLGMHVAAFTLSCQCWTALGQRPYDPQSLKYLLFDFLQKNLLIPDLDYLGFFFFYSKSTVVNIFICPYPWLLHKFN